MRKLVLFNSYIYKIEHKQQNSHSKIQFQNATTLHEGEMYLHCKMCLFPNRFTAANISSSENIQIATCQHTRTYLGDLGFFGLSSPV